MLKIEDLHASINGKEILKGINLEVKPGEVHAIMGPNGSGKIKLCLSRIDFLSSLCYLIGTERVSPTYS